MAKFRVTCRERRSVVYEPVEIEAPTMDDAILKAEEMAMNGELRDDSKSDWSSEAEEVK